MSDRTAIEWGQGARLAPSIKRIDPLPWAIESAFYGIVLALCVLAALWRPILWLPEPPGPLTDHIAALAKAGVHRLLPLVYAVEARDYDEWLAGLPGAGRAALVWRCVIAVFAFTVPWAFLARSRLRGRDGLIHLRGSTRTSGAEAVAAIKRKLAQRVRRRPDHEIAPGVPYPAELWTRHVLIVGGTGSGKSTVMKPLIDKVVKAREQMLLFDPKSEFTSGFKGPHLLAPWDARSLAWDIAKDMRNLLDIRRFAASAVKESHDPMWSNASRQLLVGLMIYLKKTRGSDWGWAELRDLVALPQASLLAIMKRWHPEAVRAVEKASVTTSGILINLSSFCSSIFDLAEAWGDVPKSRRVSFVEWIQGKSRFKQIILQGHGAYGELTKGYVEGILGVISAMVNSVEMSDSPNRKIWFIADEFPQMGKVASAVRQLFEVGRSRGLRCVVACQDFAQLEEIHGAPMVKALVGMCGTLIVGQIMQGETAEQLCKAFGTREVERANTSSSTSGGVGTGGSTTLSFNRDEVPLYKPSELTSRLGLTPDGEGVVLALFTGGDAYELRWPLYQVREERIPHVPAPWTLDVGMEWDAAETATPPDSLPAPPSIEQVVEPVAEDAMKPPEFTISEEAPVDAVQDPILEELCGMFDAETGESTARPRDARQDAAHRNADSDMDKREPSAGPKGAISARLAAQSRGSDRSSISETTLPKEEIVVHVVATPASAAAQAKECEPLFDAMAELTALRLGLGPLGVALEAGMAIDAASQAASTSKHLVRMGPAKKAHSATGRHVP